MKYKQPPEEKLGRLFFDLSIKPVLQSIGYQQERMNGS